MAAQDPHLDADEAGPEGRAMGLDVGDRTLGVAISDRGRIIAQGRPTIRRVGRRADLDAIAKLVAAEGVRVVVVGWPLRLDGEVGAQAFKVGRFADALGAHLGLPIVRWDERMTTVAAERALLEGDVRRADRRRVVDKVAAVLILQSWLDAQRHGA